MEVLTLSYLVLSQYQPRALGTFRNEITLVDRDHVVSLYCPDFGQCIIKQCILSEGGNDNKICRHVCT